MGRASVEERADRFQRRLTGPFRTVDREIGPIILTTRYRRRPMIELVRLHVAIHDLWVHAIQRGLLLPMVRRLAAMLGRLP